LNNKRKIRIKKEEKEVKKMIKKQVKMLRRKKLFKKSNLRDSPPRVKTIL
jgi:hypothetical protein